MNPRFVLDAWAVLAWLQGEPSGAVVRDLIRWFHGDEQARSRLPRRIRTASGRPLLAINVINLGEVFYVVGRRRGERAAREALQDVRNTGAAVVASPERLVLDAASLKMRHAISYADAFAAATAVNMDGYLVTGDPEIRTVGGLRVLWIGEDSTGGRRGRKGGLK